MGEEQEDKYVDILDKVMGWKDKRPGKGWTDQRQCRARGMKYSRRENRSWDVGLM